MDLLRFAAGLLVVSDLVTATAIGPPASGPWLRSRSSILATQPTTTARKARKGLSTVAIVVIIVLVLAVVIGLAIFIYLCYHNSQKNKRNKTGHNMNVMGSPNATRGDWWQPEESRNPTVTSQANLRPDAPYALGGQGYTYGTTVDHATSVDHHTSRLSSHSPIASPHSPPPSSRADHRTSVPAGPQGEPFQIPLAPYNRPRPPPSISPSYHTTATGGDMSIEAGGPILPGGQYTPMQPPPLSHQRQQTLEPLQPQQTGTSIYSSPYEITAMTQSTAGHPGGH